MDLAEIENEQCIMGCNKAKRVLIEEDSLCGLVESVIDGLPVRCVGGWAQEKIYFLKRYFEVFANGMKNLWGSTGLGYFEIGCGPGRCIARDVGIEFDGTPLAILKSSAMVNIKIARFIDIEQSVVDTLNSRISTLGLSQKAVAVVGSYTDGKELAKFIILNHPYGLNLIFIDSTDCSVPFSTLKEIHDDGVRFDLIINVATKTDITRNIASAIEKPDSDVRKKYKNFLGEDKFFTSPQVAEAVKQRDFESVRRFFILEYENKLMTIGFSFFAEEEINGYYELVYASSHPRGIDFWNKAAHSISLDGQRSLGL